LEQQEDKMEIEEAEAEAAPMQESEPTQQAETSEENANMATSLDETASPPTSAHAQADDSSATAVGETDAELEMRDADVVEAEDEPGETVVEADEDTVIY
jgi:hypothetical protein